MSYIPTEDIEGRSASLLREFETLLVPVPVETIAARLGIRLDSAILGEGISGVLVVQDGQATIGYNSAHPPVRQRFTIAHEIGHHVLHRNSPDRKDIFIDTGRQVSVFLRDGQSATGEQAMEIQANLFAAALLMPEEALRSELGRPEYESVHDERLSEQLAVKFQVSTQAMSIRLNRLGLL